MQSLDLFISGPRRQSLHGRTSWRWPAFMAGAASVVVAIGARKRNDAPRTAWRVLACVCTMLAA